MTDRRCVCKFIYIWFCIKKEKLIFSGFIISTLGIVCTNIKYNNQLHLMLLLISFNQFSLLKTITCCHLFFVVLSADQHKLGEYLKASVLKS